MSTIYRLSTDQAPHNDKEPALTLDRAGTLWVAWQRYVPQGDRIVARSLIDGTPGEIFEVSDQAGVHFKPTVACDGQNRVWVLWSAQRGTRWHILGRSIVGGRLGPIVPLSENEALECFAASTADAQGRVWAAWTTVREGRHQIAGRCLVGDAWSAPVLLSSGPGEHLRPVLCAGREGVWVAYETREQGAYTLQMRRWSPSEVGPATTFSRTGSWEMFPRLCADGDGGVWATWIATHDVQNEQGVIDHKVEVMAARFDGTAWQPYRHLDPARPEGYVTHLYDGLLGRKSYWGFLGRRRRPQVVREEKGDVWVLYEQKEDESVNRRGPDALFYATPLTGTGRGDTFAIDDAAYAYTVSGDWPVAAGRLHFAGQIPSGAHYGDICAGTLTLDRSRLVQRRPASEWDAWRRVRLEAPPVEKERRPSIRVGDRVYNLYWGDTHCHGNCSGDAEGEIDENYAYGRFKSGLDFMAVTDNDVIYDDTLTPSAWALLCAQAGHFNDPGRFVCFSGYERSYQDGADPPRINHRIILFPDDAQPLCHYTEPDADTLEKFVAQMERTTAFEYPHHATWWLAPCSRLGGVEVCSSWAVYIHQADTIPRALDEGYRLAFIGSSDSHRIVPGLGGALTGVWAAALNREAIMEALWAGRCFATNGERIALDVRIDGAPMGSACTANGVVEIQCEVQAPRTIQCLDLFRDGAPVLRHEVNAGQVRTLLQDRPAAGEHFYYVRVQLARPPHAAKNRRAGNLQAARGHYAWSSPLWVEVHEPAG